MRTSYFVRQTWRIIIFGLLAACSNDNTGPKITTGSTAPSTPGAPTQSDDVTVAVLQPAPGVLVGDTIHPAAMVQSIYEVASVIATVGTRHVSLQYSATAQIGVGFPSITGGWIGALPIGDLPQGTLQFSVTAKDVRGNSSTVTFSLLHDRPPTLVVTAPSQNSLTAASVHVAATCTDNTSSGCTKITVTDGVNGPTLASGTASVDATVSLTEGKIDTVVFIAVDAAGQHTEVQRELFVNSNSHLLSPRTFSGTVLDADATRALFAVPTDTSHNAITLVSGPDTTKFDVQPVPIDHALEGHLTPHGAIVVTGSQISNERVTEYANGTKTDLGPIVYAPLFVSGQFALWNNVRTLYFRNLVAEATTTVSTDASISYNSVAANGDVAYGNTAYQIFWIHNGTTLQITHDTVRSEVPVTDGIHVVYTKAHCCTSNQWVLVAMSDGTNEIVLGDTVPNQAGSTGVDYRVNNGWVAYANPGTQGESQVFTRSPSGQIQQVSQFSTNSMIEQLGSNGEIVFENASQRYVSRPPYTTLTPLGAQFGRVIWSSGHFFVIVGNSVAQISF